MVLGIGALLTAAFYVSDSLRGESPSRSRVFMSMAIKVSLALSFPLLLFVFRFFDPRELRRISELWQKVAVLLKQRRVTESWLIVVASAGAILLLGCLILVTNPPRLSAVS